LLKLGDEPPAKKTTN